MIKSHLAKVVLAIAIATSPVCYAEQSSQNTQSEQTLTIQQSLLGETYSLGVNAYLWGSALVRMEQISRQYTDISSPQADTSYRAPLNEFGHARRLSSPADKDMPTANRDTLYSSAVLDVSEEPIVLSVPDVEDRYFVINMFDMWHNLFQYVGTRETGSLAKEFLIVPPGWKGEAPRNTKVIEAPTDKVWLWGRTQVLGEQDYANVHAVQDKYEITPLSEYLGRPAKQVATELSARPGQEEDALRFFTELAEYVKQNPLDERQQALFGQFEKIGLTKQGFDATKLSPEMQQVLVQAMTDAQQIISAQVANPNTLEVKDGWFYAFELDDFGDDNALRSLVAGPYLGGQGPNEAIYPITYTDGKGKPLNGGQGYKMSFDKAPPVGAFWSLTVYDAKTKLLVSNEIKRYSVNNLTDLDKNADGSFDIHLQHDNPAGNKSANWLPTPEGNFYVLARLYIPSKEILEMKWTVPAIQNLK
ncbi:conserved hypothetical protein [Shewanella sediminis HAW-EB3]|uniref:DUF1254 domain-containing protein n=1 Tax=Shewanella sediminis (strain HAW-EB3) TaxID=425104 RepID=A8G0H0_SHESH|nr:DUF1254 domain-containing protein [Shewanella sediminis]ABV38593.1 conserved hypothetical protein [Shewanella sediminis HAW-EB3]